jgi:nucleotide-binding universal stress UspA family protein
MTFVVGYSPWHADSGLLDFAAQLARLERQSLRIVVVVPDVWPTPVVGDTDRDFKLWSAQQGSDGVAEANRTLVDRSPDVAAEAVWMPGRSVPQVLLSEAEEHGATLIIVGSARYGRSGQITLSSKTNRLLHSSPVPVAIVPRAYHAKQGTSILRATCAFRGDDASRSTLARTAEICSRTGCELRVVTFGVRGPKMYPPQVSGAEQMVLDSWMEATVTAQREAIADLAAHGELPAAVQSTTAVGRSWPDAMDELDWHRQDVLVVGSSSTGGFSQIFLGSGAAKIVRHAPVPVIVVP